MAAGDTWEGSTPQRAVLQPRLALPNAFTLSFIFQLQLNPVRVCRNPLTLVTTAGIRRL